MNKYKISFFKLLFQTHN